MALIQSASAERRPAMATLSDAQAVVESLLQHTLGLQPDLSDLPPATVALIGQAVELLERIVPEGTSVGDAAALTGELYQLIDEGLADPGNRTMPQPEGLDPDGAPPPPDGAGEPPPPAARGSRTTSSSSCRPS